MARRYTLVLSKCNGRQHKQIQILVQRPKQPTVHHFSSPSKMLHNSRVASFATCCSSFCGDVAINLRKHHMGCHLAHHMIDPPKASRLSLAVGDSGATRSASAARITGISHVPNIRFTALLRESNHRQS